MTHEEVHEAARRQPFEPFRLILTTGAAYDIRHPDLIIVGRRSAVVGVTNEANDAVYDRTIKVEPASRRGDRGASGNPKPSCAKLKDLINS